MALFQLREILKTTPSTWELIKKKLGEQTKRQTPPSASVSVHRGSYTIYLCSPFDPDLLLFVVFGASAGRQRPVSEEADGRAC